VPVDLNPGALAVNPVTNKIYITHSRPANVTVLDGATDDTTHVAVGQDLGAMVVNSVTNKVYVVTSRNKRVMVIDGATNDTTGVPALHPNRLAVNLVTNKVYATNGSSDYELTVIDGATNDTASVYTVHQEVRDVTVNPATNKVYVSWDGLTEMTDAPAYETRVRAEFDRLPGDTTSLARPNLTGKGVNRSTPGRTAMMGVGNRMSTTQTAWAWATILSGAGTDSVTWSYNWGTDTLILGENFICLAPLEDQAATTNNLGLGTPFAGNPEVYPVYRIGLAGGVGESRKLQAKSHKPTQTVVRGVLFLPRNMTETSDVSDRVPRLISLLDVSGRKVMDLKQGANDVRSLSPGVYFVREAQAQAQAVRKIVIAR
jgi:hypothetical protein